MNLDWESFFRAQQGNEEAWCRLTEQHQERLAALALFVTGSALAADDVVQDTFVQAIGATVKNTDGTVGGFLSTIAYRLALKENLRLKKSVTLESLDLSDKKPDPLEAILVNEREVLVAEAVRGLSAEHRDILALRCYGNHSYEEISDLLKVPIGTVRSRIFYAIKHCRETLRQKGVLV